MTSREQALERFGYGPLWITSGVLDEALLAAHAIAHPASTKTSPEHLRWAMWLSFADRELVHGVGGAKLEAILALDLAEARSTPPTLGHAIAHDLAKRPLWRPQIERLCAHPVGASRPSFERHLLRSVLAFEKGNQAIPEGPRSWDIRVASVECSPTAILRSLGMSSPLEATFALSSAWKSPVAALGAVGAWMRGELDDAAADTALGAVRDAHAENWKFGLRIRDVVARDQIDEATSAFARTHMISTLKWLMIVCNIDLGTAKMAAGLLAQSGEAMHERGALSRAIARASHVP